MDDEDADFGDDVDDVADRDAEYGDDLSEGALEGDPADHELLCWRQLETHTGRRLWFQQLWTDVCQLRRRYRLPVRSLWWEDEILVEALAAMAAWVHRYDSGDWTDPPGKLTLLFELERLETLLRDGHEPFSPSRDRPAFDRHLELLGPSPAAPG